MKPLSHQRRADALYLARFDRPTTAARDVADNPPKGGSKSATGSAPLALSDRQLQLVRNAARALSVPLRDQFLHDVARHLADEPTDDAVMQAINVVFDRMPIFLNDAQPKETTT